MTAIDEHRQLHRAWSAELEQGTELTVDVFGDAVPAQIERDVLYDPDGERLRG